MGPVNLAPPTVDLARVVGEMPDLVRHRGLFEAVAGLAFAYPSERVYVRGHRKRQERAQSHNSNSLSR